MIEKNEKILKKTELITQAEYERFQCNFNESEKLEKEAGDIEVEIYTILKNNRDDLCIIYGLSALSLYISARKWELYDEFKEVFRRSVQDCSPDVSLAVYKKIKDLDDVKNTYLTPIKCADCGKDFVIDDIINDFRSLNTPSCILSNKQFLTSKIKRCYECDFAYDLTHS